MIGSILGPGRYMLPLLVILAGTALGLLDAFLRSAAPVPFPLPPDERLFIVTQRTVVGDAGPVFARSITAGDVDASTNVLVGNEVAPTRATDALLLATDGTAIGVRLFDTGPALMRRVGTNNLHAFADECREPVVYVGATLAQRLSLVPGSTIVVADQSLRIAGTFATGSLQGIPGSDGVDVIRCSARATEKSDQLLVFSPTTMTAGSLLDRLRAVPGGAPRSGYEIRWHAIDLASPLLAEERRRSGWLHGCRLILLTLAVGAVGALSMLRAMLQLGDEHVRRALGEGTRHRWRRVSTDAVRLTGWSLPVSAGLTVAVLLAWTSWDSTVSALRATVITGATSAAMHAVLLAVLGACTTAAMRLLMATRAHSSQARRASTPQRPLRIACFVIALLCASVAVPASFLADEFMRLSGAHQGYEVEGLYSAELRLIGHAQHGHEAAWQEAAWQRLESLIADLADQPAISGVGAMAGAPWSYASERNLLSGNEHMVINVSTTPGTLTLLQPTFRRGGDFSSSATHDTETIVHELGETARSNFLPTGTVIVGELANLRFSPLKDGHQSAIVTPMRGVMPAAISVVLRTDHTSFNVARIQDRLGSYREHYVVGPVQAVADIIGQRLRPLRLNAMTSIVAAAFSLVLLFVVMLVTLRVYLLANRREMALRLCVGASPRRVVGHVVGNVAWTFGTGWLVGSTVGLGIWRFLTESIQDQRFEQPWSMLWLLPPALIMVCVCAWIDMQAHTQRFDLREALAS